MLVNTIPGVPGWCKARNERMTKKTQKAARRTNTKLMRGIYLAVIIGIVAIVVIVTLESIVAILRDTVN